jgi:hypothetical protein
MSKPTALALPDDSGSKASLDQMSRSMQRQTTRAIEQVRKRTIVASQHEEGRAQITQAAMMGAATVGMVHEALVEMSPMAEENLRALSMAYGIGASKAIMQW